MFLFKKVYIYTTIIVKNFILKNKKYICLKYIHKKIKNHNLSFKKIVCVLGFKIKLFFEFLFFNIFYKFFH